jgi:hypothetical protein
VPGRRRHRGLALVAAAAVLAAAGWLAFERFSGTTTTAHAPAKAPAMTPAQITKAIRNTAAAWVAQQVSGTATVSCDPAMCLALKAHGVHDLLVLQPKATQPAGSIVVATAAIRSQFGSRLAADYAPALIASFGSGSTRIDVRQAVPNGEAAYRSALRADLQQRKGVENALLQSLQIVTSAQAREQLAAGNVDARLSTLIEGMAAELSQPVHILSFGDPGPRADVGIPLRSATLVGSAATLRATRAFALEQTGNYHPSYTKMTNADGQHALIIEFAAPIPLELLGPLTQ